MLHPPLYHFTCDHARARITGTLVPSKYRMSRATLASLPTTAAMACGVVWLTDLPTVTRFNAHKVGLFNDLDPDCDRTRWRYRVLAGPETLVGRWTFIRKTWDPAVVAELEAAPGVEPHHWWVSPGPVPVVLDPHRATVSA